MGIEEIWLTACWGYYKDQPGPTISFRYYTAIYIKPRWQSLYPNIVPRWLEEPETQIHFTPDPPPLQHPAPNLPHMLPQTTAHHLITQLTTVHIQRPDRIHPIIPNPNLRHEREEIETMFVIHKNKPTAV